MLDKRVSFVVRRTKNTDTGMGHARSSDLISQFYVMQDVNSALIEQLILPLKLKWKCLRLRFFSFLK